MKSSFHNDTKYCPCCRDYVRYLASIDRSYCIECGGETRLFSEADWTAFQEKMAERKPKGGRPRKGTKKPAAQVGGRRAARKKSAA